MCVRARVLIVKQEVKLEGSVYITVLICAGDGLLSCTILQCVVCLCVMS